MANVSLAFDILAKDRASKTLKNVGDAADKSGRQINAMGDKVRGAGSRLGGIAKAAGIATVGIAGLAVVAGKSLIDAATESQRVGKQTEAVLKSMGPAAGVTSKHIASLSKRLSEQAGIDDELIQAGQNVLLTFGKVQNKVGKGNKIFDRATKAALNMSVALGTDMQGATIQVGKALNDPIKGITALSRAGVSFTQKQKDTIKSLVEQGKTLDAQKIILGELEKQFGGSAAAQATAGDRLKVIWGNLQEDLGMRLLPLFERAATWLSQNLPAALDTLGRWLSPLIEQIGNFWNALTTGFTEDEGTAVENVALGIRDAAAAVKGWFDENGEALKETIGDIFGTIGGVLTDVKDAVDGAFPKVREFGEWLFTNGPGLHIIIMGLATALTAYAVSAIAAGIASIAPIVPFLLMAAALGAVIWATDRLIDNNMPELSGIFQWIIDHAIVPFIDACRLATDILKEMIDLIKQVGGALPDMPGGGGLLDGLVSGAGGRLPIIGPLLPFGDDGGVWPGPRGKHSLGWVAGGETLVPTHKPGVELGGGELHLHVTQLPGEDQVGAGLRALNHHRRTRLMVGA